MTDDAGHRKRALRAELRERRRIMTPKERAEADAAITQHLIDLASDLGSTTAAAYLSTIDEPSTRGFLQWADSRGIRVLLPVSRADGLLDWAPYASTGSAQAASTGSGQAAAEHLDLMGMPAPDSELLGPIAINEVDLIIVPAASIDRTGMRMGWGRGYFDKTLGSMESRPPVYAVVFDNEFVDELPSERHDQRVDGVVTPSGIVALPK